MALMIFSFRKQLVSVAAFFFCFAACTESDGDEDEVFIVGELNIEISSLELFEDESKVLSDVIYQASNRKDTIIIADFSKCLFYVSDLGGEVIWDIPTDVEDQFPYCPHSVDFNGDTAFVYYNYREAIIKILNGKIIETIELESLHLPYSNPNTPFKRLNVNRYLIPTGYNVMKSWDKVKNDFRGNPETFMKEQFIFTLYNRFGHKVGEFGKYPSEFLKRDLFYQSLPSYFYVIKDSYIYLIFSMGKYIYKFDFDGNEIDKYYIELPGFNYSIMKNDRMMYANCILGFGIDHKSEPNRFFITTLQFESKSKTKNILHEFTPNNKKVKSASIFPGNVSMMPNIYENEIHLLRTYPFIKEEIHTFTVKLY